MSTPEKEPIPEAFERWAEKLSIHLCMNEEYGLPDNAKIQPCLEMARSAYRYLSQQKGASGHDIIDAIRRHTDELIAKGPEACRKFLRDTGIIEEDAHTEPQPIADSKEVPEEINNWITMITESIWEQEAAIMEPGKLAYKVAIAMYHKMQQDKAVALDILKDWGENGAKQLRAAQIQLVDAEIHISKLLELVKEKELIIGGIEEGAEQWKADYENLNAILKNAKFWPLVGYAPGHYGCICVNCQKHFAGDKRAVQCLQCALSAYNSYVANLELELKEAKSGPVCRWVGGGDRQPPKLGYYYIKLSDRLRGGIRRETIGNFHGIQRGMYDSFHISPDDYEWLEEIPADAWYTSELSEKNFTIENLNVIIKAQAIKIEGLEREKEGLNTAIWDMEEVLEKAQAEALGYRRAINRLLGEPVNPAEAVEILTDALAKHPSPTPTNKDH